MRSLAALSNLDPAALGLSSFGPSTPYFPRQIRSLTRVSLAQAEVTDIETGKRTGMIPDFDAMIAWYQSHLPDESKTGLRIAHGDYKLDNLIFHPTENKVIGILDWELCTLGSPVCAYAIGQRACLTDWTCAARGPRKRHTTMARRPETGQGGRRRERPDRLQGQPGGTSRPRGARARILQADEAAVPNTRTRLRKKLDALPRAFTSSL